MAYLMNNFFNYAGENLSIRDFVVWLSSYAMDYIFEYHPDKELTTCAQKLVGELLRIGGREEIMPPDLHFKTMERKGKTDIWFLGASDFGGYRFLVDDAKHWKKHKTLLYKERRIDSSLRRKQVFGIYITTSDEKNLREVRSAGYKLFSQEGLLTILKGCASENAILKDFREYLESVVNNDEDSLKA